MSDMNQRKYGLDILRILLAFMVITLHINAGATGKVLSYSTEFPWNVIVGGVTTLCYPAVNCYVLICGYFSWNKKSDVKKKLFHLWLSLVFFSVLGYLIVCIASNQGFNITELIKRFFPLIRVEWWYMVDYFALVLLSPAINKMIECLSRNQHRKLNILCIILFSVLPMLNKWEDQFGVNYGYGLLWFVVLYLIGSYLSKYNTIETMIKSIKCHRFLLFGILYLFTTFFIMAIGKIIGAFGFEFYLNPYNSILTLLQSVFLCFAFVSLDISNKTIIAGLSYVAPLSLASYLFHCQEDIDVFLWELIKPWMYSNSISIIIVYFLILLGVFVIGISLEKIRIVCFKKINNWLDCLIEKNSII